MAEIVVDGEKNAVRWEDGEKERKTEREIEGGGGEKIDGKR